MRSRHNSTIGNVVYTTVAGGSPYGVTFGGAGAGAGGVYAPPPYEQLQHHQAIPALSQQLPVCIY